MSAPFVVYVDVDVDDTLVRSFGTKRIPITRVIDCVRSLHRDGAILYCWSAVGGEYARASAAELGLSDCFTAFLAKPNLLIDDQPLSTWRRFAALHPNEAASKSLGELIAAVEA